MRQSFLFVVAIRNIAILANAASLVVERFAASFKPDEMHRLCYVHSGNAPTGRSMDPGYPSWRPSRCPSGMGCDHRLITSPTDSYGPLGSVGTDTRYRRVGQTSSQPRG